MNAFAVHVGQALLAAGAMAWQVGWSLVLGFVLSGIIQAVVSKDRMREQLGRSGIREIALATGYGAASSSCSYAAAALSRARHHPVPAYGLAIHGGRMDRRRCPRCYHVAAREADVSQGARRRGTRT